jgi:hypothetical protein
MRSGLVRIAGCLSIMALAVAMSLPVAFAAGKTESFTGEVGDAMCGAKHEMDGSPAECTRACIKQGSKYALIEGEKVYTLETKDAAALAELDKLAGQKATVKGTANGTTVTVTSVAPAK